MNRWFVSRESKLKGPYTMPELEAMVKAGALKPGDMVCPEGGAPMTASRVPGLFPKPAPAKPAPTAPAKAVAPVAAPAPVASKPAAVVAAPAPIASKPAGPAAQAAGTPSYGMLIIGVGVLGFVLLGCLPVTGLSLAWYLNRDVKKPGDVASTDKKPAVTDGGEKDGGKKDGASDDKKKAKKTTPKDGPEDSGDAPPIAPQVIIKKGIEPPPPPMDPRVREAIDRGAAHLKKRVRETGLSPLGDSLGGGTGVETGVMALAGLAMLEAGVSAKDPAVQSCLQRVRQNSGNVTHIYSLGAVVFFLNRLAKAEALDDSDKALQRTFALRIVAGQCNNGLWTYRNPTLTADQERQVLDRLESKSFKPLNGTGTGTSHSMTQFGLLALWASSKQIPVRQPILYAAASFHNTQYGDGSWSYARPDMANNFHDSNTCAGLLALAMEKTLREDKAFQGTASDNDPPPHSRADAQCANAFAHLGKIIGRTRNTPVTNTHNYFGTVFKADAWGDYYFLWCLERVSVIYGRKDIGGKDWYKWGSDVILANQRSDGRWQDIHGDVPDTCFAILFLTRANLAPDLTESIRTRGGMKINP